MKCFRHFSDDAVGTAEVYVGKDSHGAVYRIRPLCQSCFDNHRQLIQNKEDEQSFKFLSTIFIFLSIVAVIYISTHF